MSNSSQPNKQLIGKEVEHEYSHYKGAAMTQIDEPNLDEQMDNKEYVIEKGIPFEPVRKRTIAFPLGEMEIGDSFVMPLHKRNSFTAALTYRRRNGLGGKFRTRMIDKETVRVWRIG